MAMNCCIIAASNSYVDAVAPIEMVARMACVGVDRNGGGAILLALLAPFT